MLSEKILRSISNGLVRTLILSILSKKPVSGYSLLKEVEQITGVAYHVGYYTQYFMVWRTRG